MASKKPGKGSKARSAITGRYTTKAIAKRHPKTTVVEATKSKNKPGKGGGSTKGAKK